MPNPLITVSVEERVATVRIDRPQALNALCDRLVAEMDAALDGLEGNPSVAAVVLTGGPHVFAAGADLKEMAGKSVPDVVGEDFSGCCHRLAAFQLPVIAAVAGYALGGGCELVEMCDIVIAADTARFGHPEVTVGTLSGAGGTQRLPRAVGKHKAMDLLLTGRIMDAQEAERAGLVSRLVPEDKLLDTARSVAQTVAARSRPVLRLLKQAVLRSQSMPLDDGLAFERKLFQLTFGLHDRREGMEAFAEKREPRYQDR